MNKIYRQKVDCSDMYDLYVDCFGEERGRGGKITIFLRSKEMPFILYLFLKEKQQQRQQTAV